MLLWFFIGVANIYYAWRIFCRNAIIQLSRDLMWLHHMEMILVMPIMHKYIRPALSNVSLLGWSIWLVPAAPSSIEVGYQYGNTTVTQTLINGLLGEERESRGTKNHQ